MKFLIIISLLISWEVRAQSDALTSDFRNYVIQSKLGSIKEQSYCYQKDNLIHGYQPSKLQRIASVTKLFSTLLISETTDLHKTYETRFHIGKDAIHIEGGKDPYFEEDKLLILFHSLNTLGITKLKQVSFNRNFLFNDLALGSYEHITPEKSRTRLEAYLNPKNVSFRKSRWASVRKFAAEEGIMLPEEVPSVTASSLLISEVNPLKNENTQLFVHTSRPLHYLLKAMNVQSKNYVAENIYREGTSTKTLKSLFKELGIPDNSYRIYNGSGLPMIGNDSRLDNLATCETVLKAISLLSKSLTKHNLKMSDVVAVNGGKDLGSFRNRFEEFPETHEAVVSKTGTLKHTSSLAGVLFVGSEMPFAILNHSTSSGASRLFQDRFVARMFDYLGSPAPLIYDKISIFPWDGTDFLRLMY